MCSSSVEVSSQQAEVVAAAAVAAATAFPSSEPSASSITVVHGSLIQFKVFTHLSENILTDFLYVYSRKTVVATSLSYIERYSIY